MDATAKILLIEDDASLASALHRVLAAEGYHVTVRQRGDEGLAFASQESIDLVVTDLKLPGLTGLELVRELHARQPRLPIILCTAHGTTDTAIEATKYGAFDYLLKPFDMEEFLKMAAKAIASGRLMSSPVVMGDTKSAQDAIIGRSPPLQAVFKEIGRIATKPVSVLIRGETGTGKELIARAIYQHSDRANAPFIAINCAAIPETLLESELFGHERGAFTGAESRRIGRFEQAHHGTIFLDEIGDMSLLTQAKVLRVLQEKSLQRLGGSDLISVDVRVLAATHYDLEAAMRRALFREDLYYRLSVVVITLPPLRQRKEDIPELIHYFLRKYGAELGVTDPAIVPEAIRLLQAQSWPGNVRELENVTRKLLLFAHGYTINQEHVQTVLRKTTEPTSSAGLTLQQLAADMLAQARNTESGEIHARLIEAVERELFKQAVELAQGNQAKAARWLGLSRLTLREKLRHFNLHPPAD